MNDSTKQSMEYTLSERNRMIKELRKEIDTIYLAARPLIDHAKESLEGRAALEEWDRSRPNTLHGRKI